jgi:hypothetical protein
MAFEVMPRVDMVTHCCLAALVYVDGFRAWLAVVVLVFPSGDNKE